jgi:hypothetical protein
VAVASEDAVPIPVGNPVLPKPKPLKLAARVDAESVGGAFPADDKPANANAGAGTAGAGAGAGTAGAGAVAVAVAGTELAWGELDCSACRTNLKDATSNENHRAYLHKCRSFTRILFLKRGPNSFTISGEQFLNGFTRLRIPTQAFVERFKLGDVSAAVV